VRRLYARVAPIPNVSNRIQIPKGTYPKPYPGYIPKMNPFKQWYSKNILDRYNRASTAKAKAKV
jgi:hypothetical protein